MGPENRNAQSGGDDVIQRNSPDSLLFLCSPRLPRLLAEQKISSQEFESRRAARSKEFKCEIR